MANSLTNMKAKKEIPAAGFCIIRPDLFKENVAVYFINRRVKYPFAMLYRWLNDDEGFQVLFKGKWRNEESIDFEFLSDEKDIIKYVFAGTHQTEALEAVNKFTDEDLMFLLNQCGYKKTYTRGEMISMVRYLALTHKFNAKGLKHTLLVK